MTSSIVTVGTPTRPAGGALARTLARSTAGGRERMVEHARAVIIGGGVGGTSIAYHLAERGWTDVVLVDRAELTSGSTFHSAGLVGQLRELGDADPDDDVRHRRCTGGWPPRPATDPSWHEVGSLRLASSPGAVRGARRQAGWAKTFGLPLELITRRRRRRRVPADVDRRRPRRRLAADRRLARPVRPRPRARRRARATRRRDPAPTRGSSRSARERGRVTGVTVEHRRRARRDRGRRRRQRRRHVRAGDRADGRRHRADHPDGPPVPLHRADRGRRTPACRSCATPTTSSTSARRSAGLCMGGYERDPAPWSLDGVPADFNGKLLAPDWPRFAAIMDGAIRRVPAIADAGVSRMINGPEAFTPDNEFILGESEVRGFFVAAGFCAHGIAGAGGIGRQMARWIVDGEPELDLWKMDIRRFGPAYRSQAYTLARIDRELRDLLRHPLPERGAPGRPPAADLADLRASWPSSARPSARSRGWERPNWFESNARGRRRERSGRAAGPGMHWSPGDRGRGARDAADGRPLRRDLASPSSRSPGRARSAFLERMCANDIDRPVGSIVYTQLLNRRGGIECRPDRDAARADDALPARHRHGVRQPRRGVAPAAPARGRLGHASRDVTSARVCFGLWGPRARDILAAAHARRPLERGLPVPHRARDHDRRRAGPRAARHVRRRARLGALRPDRVRPRAVDHALGGRPAARAWSPRATGRSTRSGSRRATASGRATSRPDETPYEAGLGFAVALDKARRLHRPRGARRGEGGRPAQAPALPRPRRPALGLPRQRAGPGRRARSSGG